MTMAKPGLAQDQTVEEILASIRQVINGDQARPAAGAARPLSGVMPPARSPSAPSAPPPRANGTVTPFHGGKDAARDTAADDAPTGKVGGDKAAAADDDGAERDVIEMAIEQALDALDTDKGRSETAASPTADARALRQAPARPRIEARPAREASHIMEPAPRPAPPQASRGLLSPRANAAITASFDDLTRVLASRGSREIDHTVEDLLRPMLKTWLEDNLPSLVERLVREEIERVSRGGR